MAEVQAIRLREVAAEIAPKAFGRPTGVNERIRLIVDAAARRFQAQGFHGTSMQDIAEDVGITKAALYHYFDSKERMLFMVHDAFVSTMLDAAEEFIADHGDPEEQLAFFIRSIFDTVVEYQPYVKAFFRDYGVLTEDLYAEIRVKRDRYEGLVENCLVEGVRSGVFAADLDPRLGALFLFGACNWSYQWIRPDGPNTAEELAVAWRRMLVGGLRGAVDAPSRTVGGKAPARAAGGTARRTRRS